LKVQPIAAKPLADNLRDRDPVVGLIVKMPNPSLIEHAHFLGFDLVVIDTEHGLGDGMQLEHHLRAADSVGIKTLVRVGDNSPIDILRTLDAGAHGIIVPHISNAAEAHAAVTNAHYPPLGARGLAASTRAGRYSSTSMEEHLRRAAHETVVIAQIEDGEAVANTDTIASTPGINGVWIGPGDLSLSLGLAGQADHPEVAAAVRSVVARVTDGGKAAAAVLVKEPKDIEDWSARGASVFLITAVDLIAKPATDLIDAKRALDLLA
jgi:4-hydroxy-2-oxoheptanedioate aldolase